MKLLPVVLTDLIVRGPTLTALALMGLILTGLILMGQSAFAQEWTTIRICQTGSTPILLAEKIPGKLLSSTQTSGWRNLKTQGCYKNSMLHGDTLEFGFVTIRSPREVVPIKYDIGRASRTGPDILCMPVQKDPAKGWRRSGDGCSGGVGIPMSFLVRADRGGGDFSVTVTSDGVQNLPASAEWAAAYDLAYGGGGASSSAPVQTPKPDYGDRYVWAYEAGCYSLDELYRTRRQIDRVSPTYGNFQDFAAFVLQYGRQCDPERFSDHAQNLMLPAWSGRGGGCVTDATREYVYARNAGELPRLEEEAERKLAHCK
ncbi:hypothetical protein LA6_003752 [Marinibacterium anthonyi]|nr:hypothetical protein LA6_003752 [Marinibacterium anthonyi]